MKTLLQNRYELMEIIGDGGMATVYKAHCTLLDRIVAVKILKDEYARDRNFVLKFKSEAQAAARLSHPNIVNIYDVGEDNGLNFIVMEYLEGTNLKELIAARGPLPPDEAIKISMMICDALGHAHDKGLIHRDIKPHNILITGDGTVKVADFGIARAASSVTITYSGNMVGSVHYVSPEQARGEAVDNTSDLYSLGCVIYEMVTGRVPFDADSPVTIALKHIHENPKPPSILNEAVSRELETVILTAMEKTPGYRFHSAQEMKQALFNALMGNGKAYKKKLRRDKTLIMPAVGGEDYEMTRKKKKKISPTGYLLILVVLLGFAAGVLYTMRGSLLGREVAVPNLVGSTLSEATTKLTEQNLKIKIESRINSSKYDKDVIISQKPEADTKVKEGRQISVVVSKGANMTEVPDITGRTLDDARYTLKNQELNLGEVGQASDPNVPAGVIISQSPEKGTEAKVDSSVNVTVSTGNSSQLNMPNLIGLNLDSAKTKLTQNGLTLDKAESQQSDQYFSGQVISQSIPAGEQVDQGTGVSLVVSSGPGPVAKTAVVKYTLPPSSDYSVLTVVLNDAKGQRQIYSNSLLGGYTFTRSVDYYGTGTVTFIVDGQTMQTVNLE